DFVFNNPTKIIFGRDTEKFLGEETRKYGKKALFHYGGGSIKKIGLYDKCIGSLKSAGIEIFELGGVQPNPRLSLVREGIKIVKDNDIDIIIAVGGGSTIDSSKAIGMGVCADEGVDVWDFYTGKATPKKTLPVGTVLTIPAAGSESSNSSVITNMDGKYKKGCTSEKIYPVFSILNPENTYSLPAYQTACGASDILAHLMERYFVNVPVAELSDRMIEGAMKTVIGFAPKAIAQPQNYDVRAEVMWTGTVAHNNLLDQGRGGDWSSHRIEHELSGIYDIAHGAGLAIVFPAWLKYAAKTNPGKIIQMGQRVFDITESGETAVKLTIEALENFYKLIGMPTRLSDADINSDDFDEMARKAVGDDIQFGNYVKLDFEAVNDIFKSAIDN
ncbi:MAG: iron-containing alcohol dehydrogenase, partial [Lachnoclostridium sp.]|nr:iron-containing alcohol dehydrogenase [Lachnoclostridium sp.]